MAGICTSWPMQDGEGNGKEEESEGSGGKRGMMKL